MHKTNSRRDISMSMWLGILFFFFTSINSSVPIQDCSVQSKHPSIRTSPQDTAKVNFPCWTGCWDPNALELKNSSTWLKSPHWSTEASSWQDQTSHIKRLCEMNTKRSLQDSEGFLSSTAEKLQGNYHEERGEQSKSLLKYNKYFRYNKATWNDNFYRLPAEWSLQLSWCQVHDAQRTSFKFAGTKTPIPIFASKKCF